MTLLVSIIILLVGCSPSVVNELNMQYNPQLVSDTVYVASAQMQIPKDWRAMSDSLKLSAFGDSTLAIYVSQDNKAMMHITQSFGNPDERALEIKAALQEQNPISLDYDIFHFNNLIFHQIVMDQGTAITFKLLVANAQDKACEVTYTLDKSIYEQEIRKIESSIASILLQQ